MYLTAIRQLVILFDLKTSNNDANKPYGSLALLNSTASTYLHTNSSDIEVEPITVNIFLKYILLFETNMLFKIKKFKKSEIILQNN